MLKKKSTLALLVFAIGLGIHTTTLGATGVITGSTVKLREGASTDTKYITLLSAEDKVEVLQKEGDWYQVKVDEKTGYVHADYVKVDGDVAEKTEETEKEEQQPENIEGTTEEITMPTSKAVAEETTLKILPVIYSCDLQTIAKDTKVTAIEEINGWFYVVTETASRMDSNRKINKYRRCYYTKGTSRGNTKRNRKRARGNECRKNRVCYCRNRKYSSRTKYFFRSGRGC